MLLKIGYIQDKIVFLPSKITTVMNLQNSIHINGLLLLVSFLGWYLFVGYENVFVCDDYWFGTNVRHYGFWNYQLHHWINWEGSYTHTFLSTITHTLSCSRIPFIANLVSLIVFSLSCFAIINTFLESKIGKSACQTAYLVVFVYLFTSGSSEIRFWMSVNFTYLLELSAILIFVCLYHRSRTKNNSRSLILELILLFVVGGCKLNFISVGFFSIIAHDMLYDYKFEKKTIVYLLFFSFFVFLNIVAPGNYIRLDAELTGDSVVESMSITDVIAYRFMQLFPFVINTILLLPISASIKTPQISTRNAIIASGFLIIAYTAESVLMFVCFHDPGPQRVNISFEFMVSIVMILLWNKLYSYFSLKFNAVKALPWVAVLLISLFNVLFILQVPASREYAQQARLRDEIVQNTVGIKVDEIPKLPKSYLFPSNLNNDEMWLRNIYLPYFEKE